MAATLFPASGATAQVEAGPLQEFRAIAERLSAGSNPYFGTAQGQQLLDRLPAEGLPSDQAADLHRRLGYELLRLGDIQAASTQMERALELAKTVPDPFGGLVRRARARGRRGGTGARARSTALLAA